MPFAVAVQEDGEEESSKRAHKMKDVVEDMAADRQLPIGRW